MLHLQPAETVDAAAAAAAAGGPQPQPALDEQGMLVSQVVVLLVEDVEWFRCTEKVVGK